MTAVQTRIVRLRRLFKRRHTTDRPELPLLSVYRDLGVVLREGRDDNFNRQGEDLAAYQLVQPGDLVLNKMKTWQGSLGISALAGIVSPAYFVCELVSNDDRRFLHHLLRSQPLIAEYGKRSKGIRPSQWDLPWEEFQDIEVRLPSGSVQRAIAGYLDQAIPRIDALMAAKHRMIQLLEDRRESSSAEFLESARSAGKPVPIWSLMKPEEKVGAAHMEVLSVYRDHGVIPKSSRSDNHNKTPDDLSRYQVVIPGDVVVNKMKAWQGSVAVSEFRGIVSPDYLVCRPLRPIDPTYLHHVLRSPQLRMEFEVRSEGIRPGQWRLQWDQMRLINIPLPDQPAQETLVRMHAKELTRLRTLASALSLQAELLAEHRQALVTAAVTGQMAIPEVAV